MGWIHADNDSDPFCGSSLKVDPGLVAEIDNSKAEWNLSHQAVSPDDVRTVMTPAAGLVPAGEMLVKFSGICYVDGGIQNGLCGSFFPWMSGDELAARDAKDAAEREAKLRRWAAESAKKKTESDDSGRIKMVRVNGRLVREVLIRITTKK